MERFQAFMEFMRPHWSALALLFTWVGIALVALRRRLHWKRRRFITRVNFSLNYRAGRSLAMRTLVESDATDVWINEYGVKRVLAAAARTTEADPFLTFKDPHEQDFVNRAVLNVLSSRFAEAFVAASLGVPVRSSTYYFAVTCEKFPIIRTIKIRVLLMEEHNLLDLFGPDGKAHELDVHNPVYEKRLLTLRALHDHYVKDQTSPNPVLGKVELGVGLGCPSVLDGTTNPAPCSTSASDRA